MSTSYDGRTFTFIPGLSFLLPKFRGLPGITYILVAVENIKKARDEGYYRVEGSDVYTIKGPEGMVDCELFCVGRQIPGQSHDSGRRRLLIDKSIRKRTGIYPEGPEVDQEPEEPKSEMISPTTPADTEDTTQVV